MIGLVTAIVGEVATILGCVAGISESATAVTLVALGTSLPDTFASMTAAKTSEYADAAIGNVTGSNSVNVFLGLGLPWVIAAMYAKRVNNIDYDVPAGDVAFSVFVFLVVAIVCFFVLIIRRVVSTIFFTFIIIDNWRRVGWTKDKQVFELYHSHWTVGHLHHHVHPQL